MVTCNDKANDGELNAFPSLQIYLDFMYANVFNLALAIHAEGKNPMLNMKKLAAVAYLRKYWVTSRLISEKMKAESYYVNYIECDAINEENSK